MNVVLRRDQRVEVAGGERAPGDELERTFTSREDLLLLRAAVETDEPPRQVVVNGSLHAGRDDQAEERECPVAGAVEQPLADPAAHPALRRRSAKSRRKPVVIGEQVGKARPDRLAGCLGRLSASERSTDG